jgi:hypothetical protein
VRGGNDLVAGQEREAAIEHPEAHGRRVGERDLLRRAGQVNAGRDTDCILQGILVGPQVCERVVVHRLAVPANGGPYRQRVGGEHP